MVTVEAVADYCQTHSTIEAARHFQVSDSYIRRLKRQAKELDPDIAGEQTDWPDPVTGELHPIIPGTMRPQWEAERIALHERLQVMSHAEVPEAEPEEVPDDITEAEHMPEQPAYEQEYAEQPQDFPHTLVAELPGIPDVPRRVIVVKHYEPWLLPYLAANFRFLLALLAALIIIWMMSSAAHATVIFR